MSKPTDPAPYLRDDGAVVVPNRIAAHFYLRFRLKQLRISQRGLGDDEFYAVLMAFHHAVLQRQEVAHHVAVSPQLESPSTSVDAVAAAAALKVTAQAVRKAILEGRLPATKVDGSWRIDRTAVEEFKATRRPRR